MYRARPSASYPFLSSFGEVSLPNINAQRIGNLESTSPLASTLVDVTISTMYSFCCFGSIRRGGVSLLRCMLYRKCGASLRVVFVWFLFLSMVFPDLKGGGSLVPWWGDWCGFF